MAPDDFRPDVLRDEMKDAEDGEDGGSVATEDYDLPPKV